MAMVPTIWNANDAYGNQKPPEGHDQNPKGMDWDLCQGHLPEVPWNPKRYFNHYVQEHRQVTWQKGWNL